MVIAVTAPFTPGAVEWEDGVCGVQWKVDPQSQAGGHLPLGTSWCLRQGPSPDLFLGNYF